MKQFWVSVIMQNPDDKKVRRCAMSESVPNIEEAKNLLKEAGITLYGGVQGSADGAVVAFIANSLKYNPDVKCDHHDHEHTDGHSCGSHGCKH